MSAESAVVMEGLGQIDTVALDETGTLLLPLGVAGPEGSTVIVALNGRRLLHEAAWPHLAQGLA